MTARSPKPSAEWNALLSGYSPNVREIALAARDLIFSLIPDAVESVDKKAKVIGYGFGAGYNDMICTIILSKAGVKLGVVGGASLPDPDRLLEGTGKVHRYVLLESASDVPRPGVKAILATAVTRWKDKVRPRAKR